MPTGFLTTLQGWGLHHCPGQPVPMPDHSFSKEFLHNSQPKLEANSHPRSLQGEKRGPSSRLGVLLDRPCWLLLHTAGWARRLHLLRLQGRSQLIFPFLVSARENISGCRGPRQSHQLGRHDYQSRSVLQMGKGEQLTPPSLHCPGLV